MKYLKTFENHIKTPVNILTKVKDILTYELESNDWSGDEDQIAWMESLQEQVETVVDFTPEGTVELVEVKGFDNYSGPYAKVNILDWKYKIWTSESGLWIDGYCNPDNTSSNGNSRGYEGNEYQVANVINAYIKGQELLTSELDYLPGTNEVEYTHNRLEDNHSTFMYQYFIGIDDIPELEKILDRFIKKYDIESYKLEKMRVDDLSQKTILVFINLYIDDLTKWIDTHVDQ